ncbi:cell division protein FtsZ [Haliovirga abyssi]|uniref:Cell division protein FtsZ n=1 Tax=Haliovirga abyssi TaxID=2996794 RepID=A0AAU9DG10_9FUSO|nr:cell division protein FtsZ [Haliovirga abyssi]BDU49604.1 cell division protein FtsZ [Haliovirga abyssi]
MTEINVYENVAKIKVIGIGGAGGNAINNMIESGINGVEFIAANTDSQDLLKSKAEVKIQLGEKLTKGLGAGANPEVGKLAAEEDKEKIREHLEGTDLLFITAGMGGGTGTGAAPVIAEIAKELNILTVSIVTKPFRFEGLKRKRNSESGIMELENKVDTLVVIPNEKLLENTDRKVSIKNAFEGADDVLKIGIKGISELITTEGFINLDFADVRSTMSNSGIAMLGFGYAEGEDKARVAAEAALSSNLLERDIHGASKILLNITGGMDLTLNEASEIAQRVTEAAGERTTDVIFGTVIDESMEGSIKITVIATSFEDNKKEYIEEIDGINSEEKEPEERVIESKKMSVNDEYKDLDIPAFIRRKKN